MSLRPDPRYAALFRGIRSLRAQLKFAYTSHQKTLILLALLRYHKRYLEKKIEDIVNDGKENSPREIGIIVDIELAIRELEEQLENLPANDNDPDRRRKKR